MKTIKNIIYTAAALTAMLTVYSCSEEDFNILPPEIVAEDYFTTPENAEMAIVGCYDVLAWDGNHNTMPFFFGDIIGRDGHKGGDVGGDQPWMDSFINFQYDNTETKLDQAWSDYYLGVSRCNVAIENISKMSVLEADFKNLLLAEAHFIRGYFYFELVKTFGEVPLVDHVLGPSEYDQNKVSTDELYAFMERDFAFAGKYLPTKSELGSASYGRATKGAADAYRAKVYMYTKQWTKAYYVTDSIINNDPQYGLMDNYADVFTVNNEHSKELIFEIEFLESGDGSFGDQNEGNMLCVYMTTRAHPYGGIGGWGFNCPTQEFVDEFEAGDPRLEETVIRNGEILWAGTADEAKFNNNYPTNIDKYSNQKYALPVSQQPVSPYDSQKNWIVIRYADVLLWNAEAQIQSGLGSNWKARVNEVRARVDLGDSPISDPLKSVYHERRMELGMEGHRFWDVVRQGRGEEVYGKYGYVEGVHNHLPIPQNQIDLNNGSF